MATTTTPIVGIEPLNQFMKKIRTDSNSNFYTHTSIEPYAGRYSMTRDVIEEFWEIYNHKIPNTITEISTDYSMFRIDIDIKRNEYSDKFYTYEQVRNLINKINNQLKLVIDNWDDKYATCCLLEKEVYFKDPKKGEYSGGFHLQYPYVFIENKFIMKRVLNPIKESVKNETGFEFDDIYKKPWYLYGSCKYLKRKPYILTKIYNVDMKEMALYETFKNYDLYDTSERRLEIKENNIEKLLPRILSINPFNRPTQELKPELVFIDNDVEEKRREKPKKNDDRSIEEKLIECKKLLPLISSDRVESFDDWMNMGFILYSIGEGCQEALDLWDEKSSESNNYDAGCCEDKWAKMRVGNYTIATLHFYAKEDSPEEYAKMFKKSWVQKLLNDFTDLSCAKAFKEHNDGEIFYTESHKWIIFDKKTKFWSFNNNKDSLVYHVCNFFSTEIKKYQLEFTENYDRTNEKDEEHLKTIIKTYKKVGMSKFANGVISNLQTLMTEKSDIMEQFETKPNLIAFKNGKVIDLEKGGEHRDIRKDDYIMIHTGYDLPTRNNNDIEEAMKILKSLVKTDDDLKVVLTSLCCPLYGKNKNEFFYVNTGSGGNGKGLLDAWMRAILGGYHKSINATQLTTYEKDGNRANSELAKCQYARCVVAVEPDTTGSTKLVTPTIKKWTGNDPITTRELHSKSFQFVPRFTMYLQTNGVPNLSIDDGGIQRRMKVIELPYEFKTDPDKITEPHHKLADITLKEKISTPPYRNAFFFILLDTWIENNGIFYESISVKNTTSNYFDSQNPVRVWFNEHYELDDKGRISSKEMLEEYQRETDDYMTAIKFGKLMKEFCEMVKTNKYNAYKCKKKENEEEEEFHPRLLGKK